MNAGVSVHRRAMGRGAGAIAAALTLAALGSVGTRGAANNAISAADLARTVIAQNPPLPHPRGHRLPIILWPLRGLDAPAEAQLEQWLRDLDERGFGVPATWNARRKQTSEAAALKLGAGQQRLGLHVIVDATEAMQPFFNGDESTAHVDAEGRRFFNASYSDRIRLGCPFALGGRIGPIRDQIAAFVRAYQERGLPLDVVIVDWEIDGPLEWNDAHASALRCTRCREHVKDIGNFAEFQAAVRRVRAHLQKTALADVVHAAYPAALVGNYGVYPNDGYRYWYDYFETDVTAAPFKADQRARYRPWFQEFPLTGYNLAMPVVYTWYRTFGWYDFEPTDYRWFYNMLLVGSSAGRSTPAHTPLLPFVHWHTTAPPKDARADVRPFSAENYQELLWHLLLRGHDGFALWCERAELGSEARLVQQVYAAALEYRDFLEHGVPVGFDTPAQPGPVVSGVALGGRVLVRRTDFTNDAGPVTITVNGRPLSVPRLPHRCQILSPQE